MFCNIEQLALKITKDSKFVHKCMYSLHRNSVRIVTKYKYSKINQILISLGMDVAWNNKMDIYIYILAK